MLNAKLVRSIAQFRDYSVGYHASLGKEAKHWARFTARAYGGRLLEEFSDGSIDVKADFTRDYRENAELLASPV